MDCFRKPQPEEKTLMTKKQTYEVLERRVKELEVEVARFKPSEEELLFKESIISSSSSMIATCTLEGYMTYGNPAFLKKWGFVDPEEFLGRPFGEFWMIQHILDEVMQALRDEGTWFGELQAIRKDGSFFDVEISAATVIDSGGNPVALTSTSIDITERKRAAEALQEAHEKLEERVQERTEEFLKANEQLKREMEGRKRGEKALRQSETKFRNLVESSNDWIWEVNVEGFYTYASPQVEVTLGYRPEEVIGKTPFDLMPPEESTRIAKIFKDLTEKGEAIVALENVNLHKDGRRIVLETSGVPVRDEAGKLTGYRGMDRDITERKQAEEELWERGKKYRLLADNVSDLIWTMNLETMTFGFISPSAINLSGYSPEEYEALTLQDTLPPESLELTMGMISEELGIDGKEGVDPNRSRTFEIEQNQKGGSRIWTEVRASFIRDKNGKPENVLGVTRDITERKQAEEQRSKLQEQLRQSQKMESIGTLAGGIAHDFNNILGIIVGNTELAMNDVPEWNQARHSLEEVIKASLRARDMVRQILAFSRQTDEEQKPVRISPILKESLKLLRSSTPTTIEIREDLSAPADTILGDPTQISQVLMNLCTNATHAMREKGGILGVSLRNTELEQDASTLHSDLTAGKYVVLTVSDTGYGMEPEIAQRIFDPYFTTKRVGEGTGMGLSVIHGIVKSHGGTVCVESEPGEGTAFRVFLPLLETQGMPASEPAASLPPAGTEHVLFVDDEEALVDLGKRMLQRLGYEVTVRTSSIEALEAFRAQPDKYDLLVTDMTMPNMTGVDLSKELLRIRPDVPIILCTGFSEMITEDKAKQRGIKALVMKPLVLREMAETVRRVLDQKKDKEPVRGRILIVEDDDQMLETLRRMLADAGHEIVEAHDGKVAVRLYRENPTDLIITDLIMPEKEGLELIMDLKSDYPEVKIIAISGGGKLGPHEYLPLAKDLGALATFEKPFKQEDLLIAVQEILHQ